MKQKTSSMKTFIKNVSKRTTKVMVALMAIVGFVTPYIPVARTSAQTPSGPTKRVIVQYNQNGQVLGANTESTILATSTGYVQPAYKFKKLPFGIFEVDSQGEQSLNNSSYIDGVTEGMNFQALANLPLPTIGANPANNNFSDTNTSTVYNGTGFAVAILDTGVYNSHTALSAKIINESCFGTTGGGLTSDCPGAADYVLDTADSALPCDATVDSGCGHGTHVAGIAAMSDVNFDADNDTVDDLLSGVAKGANIVAMKVFSNTSGGQSASFLDVVEALDHVLVLNDTTPIASANMSIGTSTVYSSYSECESSMGTTTYNMMKTAFTSLRAAGIAPVVATANEGDVPGNQDKIAAPACVEGAVTVGATNIAGDTMASYSNNGPLTMLLAPGGDIEEALVDYPPTIYPDSMMWASYPPYYGNPLLGATPEATHATDSEIVGVQGTSMAGPVVAGAFAVLKDKHPNASVDSLVSLLQTTGVDVTDSRPGYTVGAKKRINLTAALTASTVPTVDTFTGPTGSVNEGATTNLTLATTNASTCAMDNGIGNVATSGTIAVPAYASITVSCTGTYGDVDTATWTADSLNTRPTKPNGEAQMTLTSDSTARTGTISWTASTDADTVTGYRVFLDGTQVTTTTNTTYTFTDLSIGQTYTVAVYAVDTLGAVSLPSTRTMLLSAVAATPTTPATGLFNIFKGMNTNIVLSFGAMLSTASFVYFGKRRFF